MAISNWNKSFTLMLAHEGKWNPNDPSMYGASLNAWRSYIGNPNFSRQQLRTTLTPTLVKPFYKQEYWDKISGDSLPSGVDFLIFDFFVNAYSAAKRKSKAIAGSSSASDINKYCEEHGVVKFIELYTQQRVKFYKSLYEANPIKHKNNITGWIKRSHRVEKQAIEMSGNVYSPTGPKLSASYPSRGSSVPISKFSGPCGGRGSSLQNNMVSNRSPAAIAQVANEAKTGAVKDVSKDIKKKGVEDVLREAAVKNKIDYDNLPEEDKNKMMEVLSNETLADVKKVSEDEGLIGFIDDISDTVTDFVEDVSNVVMGVFDGIVNTLDDLYESLNSETTTIIETVKNTDTFKEIASLTTKEKSTEVVNKVKETVATEASDKKMIEEPIESVITNNIEFHSEILEHIKYQHVLFGDVRMVVAEGIYQVSDGEIPQGFNQRRMTGDMVVYKAINKTGEIDLHKSFEISRYLLRWDADVILAYDNMDPSGKLDVSILIGRVNGVNRLMSTYLNGKVIESSLTEITL